MFDGITIIIGSILMLLGLAGSILPILPGPPLSFIGLFLLALLKHFSPPLTPTLVIILAIVTILVIVMDYIIPLLGAKKIWGIEMGNLGLRVRNGDRDILVPICHACGGFYWSGSRRVVSREEKKGRLSEQVGGW